MGGRLGGGGYVETQCAFTRRRGRGSKRHSKQKIFRAKIRGKRAHTSPRALRVDLPRHRGALWVVPPVGPLLLRRVVAGVGVLGRCRSRSAACSLVGESRVVGRGTTPWVGFMVWSVAPGGRWRSRLAAVTVRTSPVQDKSRTCGARLAPARATHNHRGYPCSCRKASSIPKRLGSSP